MINFRDFAWSMGIMCRGDVTHRLKLIYCLHLAPAVDADTSPDSSASPVSGECVLWHGKHRDVYLKIIIIIYFI